MGTCVSLEYSSFRIRPENMAAADTALRLFCERLRDNSQRQQYPRIDMDAAIAATSLPERLEAWGWTIDLDEAVGGAAEIYFRGEKLEGKGAVFAPLAPYVEADSFLEMRTDSGGRFGWRFDGNAVREYGSSPA